MVSSDTGDTVAQEGRVLAKADPAKSRKERTSTFPQEPHG